MDTHRAHRPTVHRAVIEGLSPSEVVKVSRVGFPALRRSLERDHDVIVASAVRGLTIWDEDDRPGRAVVERPNLVGRLDRTPTHGPWSSVEDLATEPMVAAAARLRKAVTQIRGVLAPPFPVEDSWFVVLLPVDPSPIAAAVDGTEVLGLSDRILVLHEGHLTGEFTKEEATPEKVMMAATGESKVFV